MSSYRKPVIGVAALFGLGMGVALASTPFKPAPIPANYLKTWKSEANDFGRHPLKKPLHPAGFYKIGVAATPAQVQGWTITVYPNGVGLPPGQGTVSQGETIYGANCAMCHGTFANGKNGYPSLVGGIGSLKTAAQTKTLGSYWPFTNTVWDYINRAMPFYAPHTLKPDQVYALTAYLLNMNGIVHSNFVANAQSLADVKMPNRDNWDWKDPRPVTHNIACMSNCVKPGMGKITSNAITMNLTPHLTGPVDHMKSSK